MRKNNTMKYVRTITTGHIEADMLGQTLNIAEEMKVKQNTPQRPHRKKMKQRISEMYIRGKLKEAVEWSQTAPTACLRSLKVLKGKGKEIYNRVASHLRKLLVNGK